MKKIIGYLSVLLLTLLTLVSCSKPSVYKLYKDENIDLGKDTIYKLVTADEFKTIKDGTEEIVYLFYGSAKKFDCKSAILTIQTQAKQFNVDVIYYINADEYNTVEKRNQLRDKIGINDASQELVPTLVAYNCVDSEVDGGKYTFDTSLNDYARYFKKDGKLDFTKLAGFMFRDKCNKNELPKL